MKILIVNRHREDVLGGSEIQCDLLARQLQSRGQQVTYAVMHPERAVYDSPYACVRITSPVFVSLRRALRRVRPDVVYWRFNKRHLLPCALQARLAGAAFVFASSHDDDTRFWPVAPAHAGRAENGSPATGVAPWITFLRGARRRWRRVEDGVNFLGHFLADGHVAQHSGQSAGGRRRPTRVIPSSVFTDTEPFRWERPFVVWVANLKPRKRPESFLELARELSSEAVDFLAVGALQDERYGYLAQRAHVPANFHYLGSRAPGEVNGIIAASLFLVLTCEPEGFPNVLMQAWNQSKATLSLGYDPAGMIRSNGLGYVEDSLASLAGRARSLLHDPGERERIARRARSFAESNFTLAANALLLERFCEELVARRRQA